MKKNYLKITGGVFLIIILILMFFSKTIYTFNLPTITAGLPKNGKLNKLETTTGIVDWADVSEIYSEVSGKIDDVLVSEGDKITKGQPLFNLSFDEDTISTKLKELSVSRSKLTVDIENIHKKIDKTRRSISELSEETYEKDAVSDYELQKLANNIAKAEEAYENSKILYEIGAVPKQELDNAERELENLKSEYENIINVRAENDAKENKNIEDKEKDRQKRILDYEHDIEMLQQDLKTKNLDLENIKIQEQSLYKNLSDYKTHTVVYAPYDATVISVPIKAGQHVNEGQLMASFGLGYDYKIECDIYIDNNFVAVGDECKLTNSSHTITGVVTKIAPEENVKKITVSINSDEISTGETFEVKFEKESSKSYTLVPNGAVGKDSDGYYLYQIKKRKDILGKEFYVEKLRVYIGDSDNENTVITKGVGFFEPIVILSDKPFSDSATISVKNEGDFFAD